MNRKTIIIGTLMAMATTAPAAAEHWRESSEHVAPMEGIRTLRVENMRGSVEIRPGQSRDLQLAAMKVSRAQSEDRARNFAADTRIETTREGDTYVVHVHYPDQGAIRMGFMDLIQNEERPWVEVRLTVAMPADVDLSVRAASGDLFTENLQGTQTFETASGDVTVIGATSTIRARATSGDLHVSDVHDVNLRTLSGDVLVENAKGPVKARTAGGDIQVRAPADSLVLRTVSGGIRVDSAPVGIDASSSHGEIVIRDAAEHVRLSAANGEIDVALVEPLRAAEITTVSGDIVARLAVDVSCRLDLRTSDGKLDVMVPLRLTNVSRRQVSGVVREGTAPVTLKSSAGDIELHGGGS